MKKLFLIVIAVVSIFTCASCSFDGLTKLAKTTEPSTNRFIILDSCSIKDPNYKDTMYYRIIVDTEVGTMYLFTADSIGSGLTTMTSRAGYPLVWDEYKK